MIFVDGNALKTDPIPLLNRFQKQINLEDFVDFKKLIQFDNKKGFYCPIQNGKSQCLGISKVRDECDDFGLILVKNRRVGNTPKWNRNRASSSTNSSPKATWR